MDAVRDLPVGWDRRVSHELQLEMWNENNRVLKKSLEELSRKYSTPGADWRRHLPAVLSRSDRSSQTIISEIRPMEDLISELRGLKQEIQTLRKESADALNTQKLFYEAQINKMAPTLREQVQWQVRGLEMEMQERVRTVRASCREQLRNEVSRMKALVKKQGGEQQQKQVPALVDGGAVEAEPQAWTPMWTIEREQLLHEAVSRLQLQTTVMERMVARIDSLEDQAAMNKLRDQAARVEAIRQRRPSTIKAAIACEKRLDAANREIGRLESELSAQRSQMLTVSSELSLVKALLSESEKRQRLLELELQQTRARRERWPDLLTEEEGRGAAEEEGDARTAQATSAARSKQPTLLVGTGTSSAALAGKSRGKEALGYFLQMADVSSIHLKQGKPLMRRPPPPPPLPPQPPLSPEMWRVQGDEPQLDTSSQPVSSSPRGDEQISVKEKRDYQADRTTQQEVDALPQLWDTHNTPAEQTELELCVEETVDIVASKEQEQPSLESKEMVKKVDVSGGIEQQDNTGTLRNESGESSTREESSNEDYTGSETNTVREMKVKNILRKSSEEKEIQITEPQSQYSIGALLHGTKHKYIGKYRRTMDVRKLPTVDLNKELNTSLNMNIISPTVGGGDHVTTSAYSTIERGRIIKIGGDKDFSNMQSKKPSFTSYLNREGAPKRISNRSLADIKAIVRKATSSLRDIQDFETTSDPFLRYMRTNVEKEKRSVHDPSQKTMTEESDDGSAKPEEDNRKMAQRVSRVSAPTESSSEPLEEPAKRRRKKRRTRRRWKSTLSARHMDEIKKLDERRQQFQLTFPDRVQAIGPQNH